MTDQELIEKVSGKLSAVIALALLPDPHKMKTAEKVELLARFGISNQEIAAILGTSKGSVEVLKSLAKKKRSRG